MNGSEKAGHYVFCQKCSKNAMNVYIVANTRWFLKGKKVLTHFLLAGLNCQGLYAPLFFHFIFPFLLYLPAILSIARKVNLS
jgi:hypothetical protein